MSATQVRAAMAAVAVLAAGCTVGPNYRPPQAHTPARFEMGPSSGSIVALTTQPSTRPVDASRWWQSLDDPELDSLVVRAVDANLDVKIALARLQEARTNEFVVSGGTLPYVETSGAAARGTGSNSTKGRVSGPLNAGTNTAGLTEITHVVGFDAGWEIDLFGRFRRELEAAAAGTQAAAEARNDVLIALVSDVARAYFEMRTLEVRLDVARQNIEVAKQTLSVVQERFRRGLTNELDLALARRQLATGQSRVQPLEASVTQGQRRLAVLLGRSPQDLYEELGTRAALPDPPAHITMGLPVELLRRRPDIRRAERQLAAETARVGIATADLFPRVAITAGAGLQGQGLGRTPNESSFIWSAGPTAIWPLLDFGRIDSLIQLEKFRTQELLYTYRRTVLGAVEEVDDAVANYFAERDRAARLGEALDASHRAVTLATGRYEQGLIDFLNVLDAQRQLYELEDQYAVAQEAVVVQFIALFKALGGGWEGFSPAGPAPGPRPAVIAAGEEIFRPESSASAVSRP